MNSVPVHEQCIKYVALFLSLAVNCLFFHTLYVWVFENRHLRDHVFSHDSLHVVYFVEIEETADENHPDIQRDSAGINYNNTIQAHRMLESGNISSDLAPVVEDNHENAQPHDKTAEDLLGALPSPALEFATRLPWERNSPIREIPPERFKMKRSVTVEDVIRDVSRFLGLWPPGYTDDPCPDIQRKLNSLSGNPSANPDTARDLLMIRARYCD